MYNNDSRNGEIAGSSLHAATRGRRWQFVRTTGESVQAEFGR